jgi:hypothetical protein
MRYKRINPAYVWCDYHGEIHEARNVYEDDAVDLQGRPACSKYNWRPVYIGTDDKDEEFE